MTYYGNWGTKADIESDFKLTKGFLDNVNILFAVYETPGYEGDAIVIGSRDGVLFEVHGSHCSCYGLEDQWDEETTDKEILTVRLNRALYGLDVQYKDEILETIA
jgi:hypothetical protein